MKPWMLPPIVAAIALPPIAGFALGGPPLGLGLGFLVVAGIVVIAARMHPSERIATAPAADLRRRVLVVVTRELEDPDAVSRIEELVGHDAEVRIVAPARSKTLDRWASNVGPAREEAQRVLVLSAAALGKAKVPADAAVGDADLVQAVSDQLAAWPATEVILVTGDADTDPEGAEAVAELDRRLIQPLERVVVP